MLPLLLLLLEPAAAPGAVASAASASFVALLLVGARGPLLRQGLALALHAAVVGLPDLLLLVLVVVVVVVGGGVDLDREALGAPALPAVVAVPGHAGAMVVDESRVADRDVVHDADDGRLAALEVEEELRELRLADVLRDAVDLEGHGRRRRRRAGPAVHGGVSRPARDHGS